MTPYLPRKVNLTGIGYFPGKDRPRVCLECGQSFMGVHNGAVCSPKCKAERIQKLRLRMKAKKTKSPECGGAE